MKKLPDSERSIKKSVSFPPNMWAWIEAEAGDYGATSRVIQKAVKLLQEAGEKNLAAADTLKKRNKK